MNVGIAHRPDPDGTSARTGRVPRGRRLGMTLALALALVAASGLPAARGQGIPETPREVRIQASRALAEGAYEEAILLLRQLVEWFGASTQASTVIEMESTYFNLGLCYFLTGQFAPSETAFQEYIKRYRRNPRAMEAAVYIADGYRYSNDLAKAIQAYENVLKTYDLPPDWRTDVLCSLARCALAQDQWGKALPLLRDIVATAPDIWRGNWAATLLTIAYLKELDMDPVYRMVPYLLQPNSFASRSVMFNMAALEAGDALFVDERYREALWVYRLVYPKERIQARCRRHLERIVDAAETLREMPGQNYRDLLRTREDIAEVEEELAVIEAAEGYDIELSFRIARAYMEIRRHWEACALFRHLYETGPGERAEEALALAFQCAMSIRPWDRAFEIGRLYLETFPAGPSYDVISLALGQMYATLRDWPQVIALLTRALEVSPQHESMAECLFLIGYAQFMEEDFREALRWLERMNAEFPGNDREEEGAYWISMALLFDRRYEQAEAAFARFLRLYPESPFHEDAMFRHAVAEYGLSRFREAGERLDAFRAAYPDSDLAGEANMMLADIAGTFGELRTGVERYQLAMTQKLDIELYNYCAFRCGEMLEALGDYPQMIAHFRMYLDRDRPESNIPMAIFWVGKGLWQTGEREAAVDYFRRCVEKYGRDRRALGIDLIMDEWLGRSRSLPEDEREAAWRDLGSLMLDAKGNEQRPLFLRLLRAFLTKPDLSPEARQVLLKDVLDDANIEHASAAVLEMIVDEATGAERPELALRAAQAILDDFPETDYALSARMFLARRALETAGGEAVAEQHLIVVREMFASSTDAAQALLLLGNMYTEQRRYAEADKCFADILGVKQWRGALWPAALFGRGECARLQRHFAVAAAYYERLYLLYSHYTDWAAKAYLRRAECLVRLDQPDKAAETLEDMLARPEFAETAEAEEARATVAKLRRRPL